MKRRTRGSTLLVALVIGCAVAAPAPTSARSTGASAVAGYGVAPAGIVTLRGIVVSRNHAAHSFTLADRAGNLVEVKSDRDPLLGRRAVVRATKLWLGRFEAVSIKVGGVGGRIPMQGEVTWVSPRRNLYVLSSIGDSILIHHDPHLGRVPTAETDVRIGAYVGPHGEVLELGLRRGGRHRGLTYLHGIVTRIDLHTQLRIHFNELTGSGTAQAGDDTRASAARARAVIRTKPVTLTINAPTITITSDGLGASGATETLPYNVPGLPNYTVLPNGAGVSVNVPAVLAQASAQCTVGPGGLFPSAGYCDALGGPFEIECQYGLITGSAASTVPANCEPVDNQPIAPVDVPNLTSPVIASTGDGSDPNSCGESSNSDFYASLGGDCQH